MSKNQSFDYDNELEELFGERSASNGSKNKKSKESRKKKWRKPLKEHSKFSLDLRKNIVLWVMMAVFVFLTTVLYSLMVVDADGLSQKASEQYTREITLEAKRGTIYDRNMNVLATDYTVYTVFIAPRSIENEIQHKLAVDGLVDILGVEREKVEKLAAKKQSMYQVVAKEVEEDKASELRAYIAKIISRTRSHENPNGIDLSLIINLTEETKRYYPYGSLAANLIGFVSGSNQSTDLVGVCGMEAVYEKVLKGVNGKIVKAADGRGNDIAYKYETYIEAKDGQNIILTIDVTIQAILEKYLEEAYYDNAKPKGGVAGIIINPNNGEVLASAKFPSFDLNKPRELGEVYQQQYDYYITHEALDIKDEDERNDKINQKLVQLYSAQWSDKVVMETYEPGSTFKIFTASVALEEGVVSMKDTFTCTSKPIVVGGWPIHCHKSGGHGAQTFGQTLQNSCNPAFVEWGFKIGKSKFLDYYDSFGYTDKSGTDMYAEADTIYFKTTGFQFEQTELATYSFGQTFKTTMVQQIRGISTVANGGTLVTPHACIGTCDANGNIIEEYEFESKLQVISKETSQTMLSILEEGSTMGTTKNATVAGYSIAAKTGTSQKRDQKDENVYIGSCVAFAPAENPQLSILIAIDEPKSVDANGKLVFFGGVIAAPVVSKVLTEVLPYMEIPRSDENAPQNIKIENYVGFSVLDAKTKIEKLGLECKVVGTGKQVLSQMPHGGETVISDGVITIYTEETEEEYVIVPNFVGKKLDSVKEFVSKNDLVLRYSGAYTGAGTPKAVSQSIPEGTKVKKGTVVEVEFFYDGIIG